MSGSIVCACATGSCTISAPVEPFSLEITVTWPEETPSESGPDRKYVLRMPGFPRVFFLVVTWLPDVIKGHLTPCVCACATGSCTSPVVTEGHVTPSEVVSLGCSLRRPRPIFSMVTGIGGSLPEVTSVTWPEVTSVAGIDCMFCACSVFSRFFS